MPSLALPRPPAAPISSVSWTLSEALDRATYAMAAPLLRQVRNDTGQVDKMGTDILQHLLPLGGLVAGLAVLPKRSAFAEEPAADPVKEIVR